MDVERQLVRKSDVVRDVVVEIATRLSIDN